MGVSVRSAYPDRCHTQGSDAGMIGHQLGDWVLDAELGEGPLGRVFRAHAADDPAQVMVVKWLTHPRAREPGFQQRFQAEMAVLRRLNHPNIIRSFDHGTHDGSPFIVSDFVDGIDFDKLLREGKRPSWKEVLALALPLVSALRYAHRRGVLHRGLKPGNILLQRTEDRGQRTENREQKLEDGDRPFSSSVLCPLSSVLCPKITDFGLAKLFLTGGELGFGGYLVPELAAGKPVGKRSDFYALGIVLWTLLTGRPPFTGSTVVELIHKHCFVLPERPQHYVPDLPDDFDRLIMRLLAKEAAHRPGSGTLLLGELERIWGELERRGEVGKRPELPKPTEDGPEPAHFATESEEDEWEPVRHSPRLPRYARGVGLSVLLLFVVGILTWAFFFRGPDAEELYRQGAELLRSDDPADWERAWYDYFEKLSRHYPDRYDREVREARRRAEDLGELKRSLVAGRPVRQQSEAERFFRDGLRLCQAQEFAGARRVWNNLITAFGVLEKEQTWVRLARLGLTRID